MTPSLPLPASSSSDELSWIIELLEKDGMAFQEGPFGENPLSPFPSLACRNSSKVLEIVSPDLKIHSHFSGPCGVVPVLAGLLSLSKL